MVERFCPLCVVSPCLPLWFYRPLAPQNCPQRFDSAHVHNHWSKISYDKQTEEDDKNMFTNKHMQQLQALALQQAVWGISCKKGHPTKSTAKKYFKMKLWNKPYFCKTRALLFSAKQNSKTKLLLQNSTNLKSAPKAAVANSGSDSSLLFLFSDGRGSAAIIFSKER